MVRFGGRPRVMRLAVMLAAVNSTSQASTGVELAAIADLVVAGGADQFGSLSQQQRDDSCCARRRATLVKADQGKANLIGTVQMEAEGEAARLVVMLESVRCLLPP